ncbi:MAG: circadian clock KaiB family protein [Desulfobacteraceae bacterium]
MTAPFESSSRSETVVFHLFVAGDEKHSRTAEQNLRSMCEAHFAGRYMIEIMNVFEHSGEALKRRIFMTPALVKVSPGPRSTVYGTLGEEDKVIASLGLKGESW